jgi:glucokinase
MLSLARSQTHCSHLIGIDVGGSKLLACLTDRDGHIVRTERRAIGGDIGPDPLLRLIEDAIEALTPGGVVVSGIGIGFPGLVDQHGIALSSVILPRCGQLDLAGLLQERLGLPCTVDNDVNNAARAEASLRGRGDLSMLFVSVGTGIGGAVVLHGRLWSGATNMAGEIGHVGVAQSGPRCLCGRRGCVGKLASGAAIERQLGRPIGTLAEILAAPSPVVTNAVARACRSLGDAIASALNLLNLPLVVIGGGLAEIPGFVGAVAEAARQQAMPEIGAACRFERARAGQTAGAVGAALLVRDQIETDMTAVI